MDTQDTNLPLEEGKLEEEKNVPEVSEVVTEETPEETTEVNMSAAANLQSKLEVIERLKELSANAESTHKQELDSLKQTFYKLHKIEQESAKKKFIEEGGTEESFVPAADNDEAEFKSIMTAIKEKRSTFNAELEKQKEENLQTKLGIIEKLKELVNYPEDVNKAYNDFKKLQQEWNEIKLVPQAKVNELWKNYQVYVEKFYDIIKINNEFRDYDFKKNLEIKTKLCEAAERLANEADVVSAFHQLQKLHQEFRDTGPVAKELRDEIWARFKNASTEVNRRHQQHFEALKEVEQRNLDEKTVICEIVEATEYNELNSFNAWEKKTQEIIALQNKWKTIGFAPQKMNVKIFERFRAACDDFFKKKGEFFKKIKEEMNENLEKKKALCEKVETLKDSTDWKETSDILTKLQKEWKTIGPVSKKYSDPIWKRFIEACDYFFEQKNKATSSLHSIEVENLQKKKALIEKLTTIDESLEASEASNLVRETIKEWNAIGHVPFKEKDKLYKQFHDLVDKQFDRLNVSATNRKLNNFKTNISNVAGQGEKGGAQTLYREREKLVRAYESMKNEIKTYENNLGFLTSSSKKGNSLVTELNRKVEKLKSDLELTLEKIKVIDQSTK
jgi:Predicted polymerase, most proteins contain PALM domain, HD hydrolase domain and Zn-ribbon domain